MLRENLPKLFGSERRGLLVHNNGSNASSNFKQLSPENNCDRFEIIFNNKTKFLTIYQNLMPDNLNSLTK